MFNKDILSVIVKHLDLESRVSCCRIGSIFHESFQLNKHERDLYRLRKTIQSIEYNGLVHASDFEKLLVRIIVSSYSKKILNMNELCSFIGEYGLGNNYKISHLFLVGNEKAFQNPVNCDNELFIEELVSFSVRIWVPFINSIDCEEVDRIINLGHPFPVGDCLLEDNYKIRAYANSMLRFMTDFCIRIKYSDRRNKYDR